MRKIILYIAMSLDGFIADPDGGVGWLEGETPGRQEQGSYPAFEKTVDTVVMGYTTYRQIATILSPDKWPYEEMQCYVLTHRPAPAPGAGIHFIREGLPELLESWKAEEGGNIWICGGADVANQLIKADRIDRYHITVIPCILGKGIRLFGGTNPTIPLKLISTECYDGMTDLVYERRVQLYDRTDAFH